MVGRTIENLFFAPPQCRFFYLPLQRTGIFASLYLIIKAASLLPVRFFLPLSLIKITGIATTLVKNGSWKLVEPYRSQESLAGLDLLFPARPNMQSAAVGSTATLPPSSPVATHGIAALSPGVRKTSAASSLSSLCRHGPRLHRARGQGTP